MEIFRTIGACIDQLTREWRILRATMDTKRAPPATRRIVWLMEPDVLSAAETFFGFDVVILCQQTEKDAPLPVIDPPSTPLPSVQQPILRAEMLAPRI